MVGCIPTKRPPEKAYISTPLGGDAAHMRRAAGIQVRYFTSDRIVVFNIRHPCYRVV